MLAQRCAQRAVGCASCGGDGGSLGGNCGRGGGSHGSIYGILSHTHILPCRDDFAYAGLEFGGVRSLSLLETPGALDVALMPGVCFGQAGEGWVRISLLKHAAELFQVVAHVDRVLRSA